MSAFGGLLGQEGAVALLERMLDSGRLPQALLFHGPEGVGKATTARMLATALLCEAAPEAAGLVAEGNHPDLLTVKLLPKKETASSSTDELRKFILVEQIRELSHLASLAPRLGSRRIFIIDPADRMNLEAQNALLKTLEEPPGQALLILVASRPHVLISTVRSRCFGVGFAALDADELAAALRARGLEPDEALARASLAEGRPGRAMDLELAAMRERREAVLETLESLAPPGGRAAELPSLAAALAGSDEATLVEGLELLQGLLRDAARVGSGPGGAPLVHADLAERVEALGRRLGPERAAGLVASVDRLRGELRFSLNRTLVAESLLAAVAGGPLP